MDNKATTKRMIGAVVLVLVAALLLAWLLKGKNRDNQMLASNPAASTTPIMGFPGVGSEQKPQLVNDPAANPQAQTTAQATGTAQQAGSTLSNTGLKMPEGTVVPNTTGFDLRPGSGEVRTAVDLDGKVKDVTGNMGTGDAKPVPPSGVATAQTPQASAPAAAPVPAVVPATSQQDKPVETNTTTVPPPPATAPVVEKKPAPSTVVLAKEKAVPAAPSVESKAKEAADKEAAAKKAAADKVAAEKTAADKAAADKSLKLAADKAAADKAAAEKAAADKAAADKAAAEKAAADKAAADKAAAGADKPASTAGSYVIQVMATADKAKAEAVAKPLVTDGNAIAISETKVDGKPLYRVRIAGFQSREAATAAQAKLKSRYAQNQYVQNSYVTGK